ncbi:succinate dehydrogenase assembly factor 2, partial [Phenoliferia sp. Uapishka_3]
MAELIASPHPEGRDGEPVETLRKRLVYESRKRGILEMDLILATFARTRLAELNEAELREYDRFLTLPDWSIYYYVTNKSKAPEPWASSWVLNELLNHSKNTGRTVRRMPDLPNRE